MASKLFGWTAVFCLVLLAMGVAWADAPAYSISGIVKFEGKGDIYMQVVTEAQFKDKEKTPFGQVVPVGEAEEKAGQVEFTFTGVPAGTYGIRVFQDANGNDKLDKTLFWPKEPWGLYKNIRPKFGPPKFKNFSFDLSADMDGVVIEVK